MNIEIEEINKKKVPYEDVLDLIHSSYEERMRQGLYFTCSSMSVDEFKSRTKKSIVLVAVDKDNSRLLGTGSISFLTDKKGILYGYIEYAAVAPEFKRCGVGSKLLEKRLKIARDMGAKYVLSDTAVGAKSSIKYHKKNGFRIILLAHYPTTNYYSYIFRKDLGAVCRFNFHEKITFLKSFILVRLVVRRDGGSTLFYTFYKRLKKLCKK
jgi:ribosomal protein S18 acetylase RimI-like enzyme